MKKCFICGQQYDPNEIEEFSYWDYQGFHAISKIIYHNKDISLCNRCLRQTMFSFCISGNYDIEVKDKNE